MVRLPQSRILFLGDCYYPLPLHMRNPEDTFNFAMMRTFISDDIDVYVDGHNTPMTREWFTHIATHETLQPDAL